MGLMCSRKRGAELNERHVTTRKTRYDLYGGGRLDDRKSAK